MQFSKLGKHISLVKGKKPTNIYNEAKEGLQPYVDIKAFETGAVEKYTDEKKCVKCNDGDLLIVCDGSRSGLIGKAIEGYVGSTLALIELDERIDKDYLYYFIQGKYQILNKNVKGTGTPHLKQDLLKSFKLAIPSLETQKQIVQQIEEQLSQLDSAVETLKKTKQQLEVYRQAVLKEAFEGKLTDLWRSKNHVICSELVSTARRKRDKLIQNKKLRKLKYEWKDDISLPSIPDEWEYAQIGDIAWSIKDGPHYSPEYTETGVPFITGGNVRPSGVDFDSAKRITPKLYEELSKRCKPEKGDMLYTKGGTTGIARLNTYDIEFSVWVHVAVIKYVDVLYPEYFQHVLNSPLCYQQSQKYTHGVGNQDLGLTRMINIIFPICSLDEQKQIVAELESRLSECDSIEQTVNQSLQQAEALRQSILKQAFEGN